MIGTNLRAYFKSRYATVELGSATTTIRSSSKRFNAAQSNGCMEASRKDTMSVMTGGQCPVCFELTYLSLIEPHATRNDVEWRTFACSKCGPVKAVLMPIKGYRPEIPVRPQ